MCAFVVVVPETGYHCPDPKNALVYVAWLSGVLALPAERDTAPSVYWN